MFPACIIGQIQVIYTRQKMGEMRKYEYMMKKVGFLTRKKKKITSKKTTFRKAIKGKIFYKLQISPRIIVHTVSWTFYLEKPLDGIEPGQNRILRFEAIWIELLWSGEIKTLSPFEVPATKTATFLTLPLDSLTIMANNALRFAGIINTFLITISFLNMTVLGKLKSRYKIYKL